MGATIQPYTMKIVKMLAAVIAGIASKNQMTEADHKEIASLRQQKNALILNAAGVAPHRLPNQRQRRKQWRQTPQTRPR